MEKLEELEKENKFLKELIRIYDKKFDELTTKIELQIEEDEYNLQYCDSDHLKTYIDYGNYVLNMVEEAEEEIKQFRIKKRNEILWNKELQNE